MISSSSSSTSQCDLSSLHAKIDSIANVLNASPLGNDFVLGYDYHARQIYDLHVMRGEIEPYLNYPYLPV